MSTGQLLTLLETAEILRLSPHTIRSFARKGKLCPVRICRRLLFRSADVERLIAASIERQLKATDGEAEAA
jgi:predicted site-specific integrase-resolvase